MPSSQSSISDEQRWPHKKMKSGDRVKLSQRGIKACRKSRGGPLIPLDRRGTVHYANNYSASVAVGRPQLARQNPDRSDRAGADRRRKFINGPFQSPR